MDTKTLDEIEALLAAYQDMPTDKDIRNDLDRLVRHHAADLVRDARRYAWLRRPGNTKAGDLVERYGYTVLDEAIDAAIAQESRHD